MGFSGSNGGITANPKKILLSNLRYDIFTQKYPYPMEVSYFINNICNLRCKHCYVAYEEEKDSLSVEEWKEVFDELISMGALTFGNVGKEPTLTWNETRELLYYFNEKREFIPNLRFGFVTNGVLLDRSRIEDLKKIQPDYIDISLDGTRDVHDYIRGLGSYDSTIRNLDTMSQYSMIRNVFISFTANRINLPVFNSLIENLYNLGIRNILVSPYVTLDKSDELYLPDEKIIGWTEDLLKGSVIDFRKYEALNIYVKNDYTTTLNLMEKLARKGIIDRDNLLVDDYGTIFNRYTLNGNDIYFNYLPWDDYLTRAIRISHDGYVSNCYDMFFAQYPQRAIGNVRKNSITEILEPLRLFVKGRDSYAKRLAPRVDLTSTNVSNKELLETVR